MNEHENLPAVIVAQALVVLTERRVSLVGRGLAAFQESKKCEHIRNSQGERYRQARTEFDRQFWMRNPVDFENPILLLSKFKVFQQLADESFGKAYFPLSRLYHEARLFHVWRTGQQEDIEKFLNLAQHFEQLAFDWCFANQANDDAGLWCDLGEMYQDKSSAYYDKSGRDDQFDEQFNEEIRYWLTEQEDIIPDYAIGLFWADEQESQAVYWLRKAAEQGDALGQLLLGTMYDWGKGVEGNFELAVYWFRKAAEQGSAQGQGELGRMYSNGIASKDVFRKRRGYIVKEQVNDNLSEYWYRKAAKQGHYYAQESLEKLGINWEK